MHLCWLRLRYSRVTTHGTVELIVEKFSEFRVCFPYFEGGCICRYNDQFVINQIDRCCTDPITGIAAWRICRYNLRWAINPAGHSPRHTNKVLELVSKLVVHSSIKRLLYGVRCAFYANVMLRLLRPRVTDCAIVSPRSQLHAVLTVAITGEARWSNG